jgi:hypothetical protein
MSPDVTGTAPVRTSVHDISPSLESQLVLELKVWICGAEIIEVLPCGRRGRFTPPKDQHLANAAGEASLSDALRSWYNRAMLDVGERWR